MTSRGEDTGQLAGSNKDGSDELTQFAPFEAGKTMSTGLAYRGERPKPPQVEINDASYLGPPKVIFRKLTLSANSNTDKRSPRSSPQPFADSVASRTVGHGQGRRVRVHVVGEQYERDGVGVSRRLSDTATGRVTKSLVLNRIGTFGKEQDTARDLKRYWMPDSACKECSECGTKFNIIVRRHHCRICGRIFCNACCSHTIPGTKLRPNLQGNLRVCKECLEIFQEFQTNKRVDGTSLSSDPTGNEPPTASSSSATRLRNGSNSLQKNTGESPSGNGTDTASLLRANSGNYGRSVRQITTVLSPHKSWDDASSGRSQDDHPPSVSRMNVGFDNPTPLRSISGQKESFESIHEREERLMALNEDEVEYVITEIWFQLISPGSGIAPQNHRYRLRAFPNTFSASAIIAWLIRSGHAVTRDAAVTMGQALVDTKRLRVVSSLDPAFKDEPNQFLEFGQAADMGAEQVESPTDLDAPKWFQRLPENEDSEVEHSISHKRTRVRYSMIGGGDGSLLSSIQPTITISSMSELTGVAADTVPEKKEEYVVVNPEQFDEATNTGQHQQTELKLSLHDDRHSVSPAPSPPSLSIPFSPNYNSSFMVVTERELFKALPVGGLSSAADIAQDLESENGKDVQTNEEARTHFEMDHMCHFDAVMIQLIKSCGISLSWLKVIKPLIMEATRKVKTNMYTTDTMDIKQYVKVKKIPGGRRSDSTLINGVVCTKNITHKKMRIHIRNPTILLLKCAFEFQRKENQLSSFDTLQMQEEKYLKNLVARVKTFQPRVILVQKSVARLALEMFYHLDIAVAVNVKPSVMERVARSTQGDLLHSLDQLFFNVQLGTCGQFYLRNFALPDGVKKTLMYFDHCDPRLGCVITLMGGSRQELKKVKKVTLFGVFVAYNSLLESSFLIDEFAWPASNIPQLLPDVEDYSSSPNTPEWPLHPSISYPINGITPAELASKLEALLPELKEDNNGGDLQQASSSLQSTPTISRSNFGRMTSNVTPVTSPNPRSYSLSGYKSDMVGGMVHDGTGMKLSRPAVSCSFEDIRPSNDPLSLHYQPFPTTDVDAATLSKLGKREFETALNSQILSITPGVNFPIPYLQTPQGFDADLRRYLPSVIYWSHQFFAITQSRLKSSKKKKSNDNSPSNTNALEMGITQNFVGGVNAECNQPSAPTSQPPTMSLNSVDDHNPRSYRSISEHPFTTSIFLLKANTNEMRAALADYRANAGLAHPSHMFFFPTASQASDYNIQLQNIFNKYKQFTCESDDELEEEGNERGGSRGGPEGGGQMRRRGESLEETTKRKEKPLRQRARRQGTPSLTESEKKREVLCAGGLGKTHVQDVTDRQEGVDMTTTTMTVGKTTYCVTENASKHRERKESPLVTMGTLDSIDKDYSKLPPEDELLDIHGNEDITTPPLPHSDHIMTLFPPYQQVDCMDPMNHQSISILFSSTCHDGQRHQLPCVPPCIIQMLYYGRNDISLGDFLKRYCFRPDYRCQTCSSEMTKHQRHIIHGTAALHITVQQLDTSIPRSNDGLFTWLACKHCTLCTPFNKMADNSLLFSFAKFLELKFHCDQFVTRLHSKADTTCQHCLHSDYLHYFSYRNKIACFQPAKISILEVTIPPTVIVINTPHSDYHHSFSKEIKHIEHISEGVSYRIRQRLQSYNMDPVISQVKEYIASSKGERDAFRSRIKLLKAKVVHGGFLESGQEEMSEDEQEDEFAALQDGIAEIKRALTEFVSCWNIELESLDNKIRVYHSRRDAVAPRSSDRDSPFTPMATEIPTRTNTSNSLLPAPQQEENFLLNTPLSTPPDSSLEEIKVPGTSLNTEAGDIVMIADTTSDSHTELGEEVKISGDTSRSSQESYRHARHAYDTEKTAMTSSERNTSSLEDLSQLDSRISLSGELGSGGGSGIGGVRSEKLPTVTEYEGKPRETVVVLSKETTRKSEEPKDTKVRNESSKDIGREIVSGDGEEGTPVFRRRSLAIASSESRRWRKRETTTTTTTSETIQPSTVNISSPSNQKTGSQSLLSESAPCRVKKPVSKVDLPPSEPDTPVSFLNEHQRSTNTTPSINVMSEDDLEGDGEEGDRWWYDRTSPMSGNTSPYKADTASDSEGGDYKNVKTLVVSGAGQKTQVPSTIGEEVQSDGVGIFAKFRVIKDSEVREDPTRFYLVDPAEITSSPTPSKTSEGAHHHGQHHPQRPHRRPGTIPRKNGSSSIPPSAEGEGKTNKGVREKDNKSVPIKPFQKLPPPFELNEHHNMHKSLKIPIAIYEKEPTSLIAYALSSREYAQEYWALVERRPTLTQPEKLYSRPPSPKIPKKQADPPLFQLPPPTKTSALKQAYQELKKKGPLNAMNVFSGLGASSERSEPHDKSGDDSRRIEAALSSKSSQTSSCSTPSKSSQSSLSSFPPTDQSTVQEDGEGIRWNTTGGHATTGSATKGGHISLEFTAPDRTSSIFCKVYFAEEFQQLREMVFPSGEDRYIRSLSRCVKFDAKGGKSRSTFCKVIDDRFIMKQIKSVEISSFEQIAPLYFEHITTALENKRPLALAKILGAYTVGYRNTRTGNSKRLDVIVMENLLYGRKSSKVFDLKGSMRSRYIDPSKDSSNDVLLDENFLNHICYSPVYVHPHSKAVLMRAIQEDTQFLAQNAIMDYSLLTCIDDQTGELVVGIIDYVRTFTLDKRLEMYIKKTAGRVLPTVVYPELYRKRFCEAMDRYFTVVPDKWTGLGADIKL